MAAAGETVTVSLSMQARLEGQADSANVIGEIRGREKPDEVVVMGGHLDSWDVGEGAHDDGLRLRGGLGGPGDPEAAGAAAAPDPACRALDVRGELGQRGTAYRASLGSDVASHVAAIEMDGGCERPVGFGFTLLSPGTAPGHAPGAHASEPEDPKAARALASLREIASLLEAIDASRVEWGGGGTDIGPLMRDGVPGLSLDTVVEHYMDWHHSDADTLEKVRPADLQRAVGMLALMGYALADMPERLVP